MNPIPDPAPARLELLPLEGFPMVQPGDDLADLILASLGAMQIDLHPGNVLVVAQKIVSKAEGRLVHLRDVHPDLEALHLGTEVGKDPRLVQLILDESVAVLRKRPGILIVEHRLGLVHANAGIDQSNLEDNVAGDRALLLPVDPDASAVALRDALDVRTGIAPRVIISDSMGRAWRMGTVCTAIGSAGGSVLQDRIGSPDLHGRTLENTLIAVADQLAAAAGLLMGEAQEGRPVVLVRGLPEEDSEHGARDLIRPKTQDLFR